MTKKLLSCALALMMLLSLCSMPAVAEDSIYPLVDEPITIKGVIFKDNIDASHPRIVWTELAKLTGITVEWTAVSTDQKAVFLAAGEWPDFFHNGFDSTLCEEYGAQAGLLVNLNDYAEYMPHMNKLFDSFQNSRKCCTSSNGAMYSLPYFNQSTTAANCRWHFRYDLIEAAGKEIPTTIDEYYDVLVAIKAMTGAAPLADKLAPKHGYQTSASGEWFHFAAFGTATNPNFDDAGDGTVIYNRTSDQYRYYLQFMNKLYAEGLLHQEYLTLDNTTRRALIEEGKTAFGADAWGNVSDAAVFTNGFADLRQLAPLTSQYDDTRTLAGYPPAKSGGAVINANSEYVKEICQMLDIFYATEEVAEGTGLHGQVSTYGPEGITWEFTNEEKTEWEYILPEGYDQTGTVYQTSEVILSNNFGAHIALAKAFNGAMSNGRARQMGFVENLIPYQGDVQFPAGNMSFNEDEMNVISLYQTEIYSYVDEWNAWFIAGIKNPNSDADWDEYIKGFEKMGLQELIEAYQTAYTRYLAM